MKQIEQDLYPFNDVWLSDEIHKINGYLLAYRFYRDEFYWKTKEWIEARAEDYDEES